MSRHQNINVEKLARKLKKVVGTTPVKEVAKSAKIDVSRVSRFLNGDFKKLTPVLERLCFNLHIPLNEFLLDSLPPSLSPEILNSLQRIVGRDPKKILAARRLLRNLEVLAFGGRRRAGSSESKS
jgi:transcriptional regulator with XRE-family HTH domain